MYSLGENWYNYFISTAYYQYATFTTLRFANYNTYYPLVWVERVLFPSIHVCLDSRDN